MNVVEYNRNAWNQTARAGKSQWCVPVDAATIAAARRGDWRVVLTPVKPVPRHWFGDLQGLRVLCLASGGGQQAPIFAAAGARVTSLDASDEQLARDALVATREGLQIRTVQGDMADLSTFKDGSFDRVFHPISNVFARDVRAVWRESYRVLAKGGRLLSGFLNPDVFVFDEEAEQEGRFDVKYPLPYSDLESLEPEKLAQHQASGEPLAFSHDLEAQIGGQLDAGFVIGGFYEDRSPAQASPLSVYMPTSYATLALKH